MTCGGLSHYQQPISLAFERYLLSTSFIPCGKLGSHYPGKATAAARAALPIPNGACCMYFNVSKKRYGCQCLKSLTCTRMLMNVIAHASFMDTVRQSALKAYSGRKIPGHNGKSDPRRRRADTMFYRLNNIPTPYPLQFVNSFGTMNVSYSYRTPT